MLMLEWKSDESSTILGEIGVMSGENLWVVLSSAHRWMVHRKL